MRGKLLSVATGIGVITGAGTIVGWIASTKSPAVVAGTAVGYAGMAYCGAFALLSFATAVLPEGILKRLDAEGLAKATFKARALYVGFGCFFTAFFAVIGTHPLDGGWIAIGGTFLFLVAYATLIVSRNSAAKRKAEYRECPDCAETIKARARVCRYCGYRFAVSPLPAAFTGEPEPQPPAGQPLRTADDLTATVSAPDVGSTGRV